MQPRRWRFLGILDAARKLYLPICWNVRDFCCHRGSWCGVANPALPSRVAFPGKRAHEESTAGRGKECESDVPGAVHRLPRCQHVRQARELFPFLPADHEMRWCNALRGQINTGCMDAYCVLTDVETRLYFPACRCAGQLQVCGRGADT